MHGNGREYELASEKIDRETRHAIEFVLSVKKVYTLQDVQSMDIVEFHRLCDECLTAVAQAQSTDNG